MADAAHYAEKLLRGELAAVESYERALDDLDGEGEDPARTEEIRDALRRILNHHRDSAASLEEHLSRHEGDPDQDAGGWGAFARAVEKAGAWLGDRELLEAMKQGEIHGVSEYRTALGRDDLPAELATRIREHLLPRQERHIATLDELTVAMNG